MCSYFSISRLLAHFRGGDASRCEKNYLEANLVGTFIHVVALAFGFQLLLAQRPFWQELLLLLPLAFLVWIFWLLFFYFSSLVIKALRSVGLMRGLTDARAQSILICGVTTLFAAGLVTAPRLLQMIGMIWIAAVAVNLSAAIALTFLDVSAAE